MADFDLPVAFHFSVSFAGNSPSIPDAAFQEVSGLESGIEVETVVEGGENRFIHQLPKQAKHSNLKLKRSQAKKSSALVKWCKDTIETGFAKKIEPKGVTISLLDADGDPVASWTVANAYPIKWSVSSFDALAKAGRWTLEIVKRSDRAKGFELLPRRWVVERTLAWLNRNRRLAKDFEVTIESAKAWLMIGSVKLMTRRQARA